MKPSNNRLFGGFSQFMEVFDYILEVHSAMYVEAVPDVAAYHRTTKAQFAYFLYVFQRYAGLCHHAFVYQTLSACLSQLLVCVLGFVVAMGLTVVYVTQYYVLVLFLCLCQFLQTVACTCGNAFVALWLVGVSLRDMYSHQVKFVLQVEVVVGDYSLVIFLWKQGEQSFAVYRFRVWFSQV